MAKTPMPNGDVFDPPSSLRERVGPRSKASEDQALERAEAALAALSSKFDIWVEEDLANLCEARDALLDHGADNSAIDRLFTHALDIKGLGATYDYPLVTRFAASLCKILGDGDTTLHGPMSLADAHVAAIKATIRGKVRDSNDPAGTALAQELERRAQAVLPDGA